MFESHFGLRDKRHQRTFLDPQILNRKRILYLKGNASIWTPTQHFSAVTWRLQKLKNRSIDIPKHKFVTLISIF